MGNSIRLAVVGGRDFNDYGMMERRLAELSRDRDIAEVVSGGARGADTLAERWARAHGVPARVFPADWERWGKSAGFRRNRDIVADCDEVAAFWDGESRGTASTIRLAQEAGKPVHVFRYPDTGTVSATGGIRTSHWFNPSLDGERQMLVQVSNSAPKDGTATVRFTEAIPDWNTTVGPHREGRISDAMYEERYRAMLDARAPQVAEGLTRLMRAAGGREIVLLCWERPGRFCHRHVLADWIQENYELPAPYDGPITEL